MYTTTQINDVRQTRAAKISEQRKLNDLSLTEKRAFTADEQKKYDDLGKGAEADKAQFERMEKLNEEERAEKGPQTNPERENPNPETRDDDGDDNPDITLRADGDEVRALVALRGIMRSGSAGTFDLSRNPAFKALRASPRGKKEYRVAYEKFLRSQKIQTGLIEAGTESRAHQADNDIGGGYMLAPAQMVAELIKAIDNEVVIRKYARKLTSGHTGLGAVSLDTDLGDFGWTTELDIGAEDEAKIGKREMRPHPLAKVLKISKTLARNSPEFVSLLMERLAYVLGVTQEKAYLTGDGVQKPLGVFTASTDGIPTSRDVSAANTGTAITADNLRNVKYSLKTGHRRSARWLFHRDAIAMISKLKGSDNNYLWQPGLVAGDPDRLLNLPLDESEYVPNTFTTGLYVGLLANWDYYWILDSLDLAIQVLVELYAGKNQNGYHARYEGDGMPVLGEAFARVTLA